MPNIPSNIEELLDLVVQEIIDNTSGLIEEHTLRYVLSQIVKVLDTKISLISPELTEEQLAMWKKLADFKASDFIGTINSGTVFPDVKSWGFAGPGTYGNADGVVIPADHFGVITFDGNLYSQVSLPLPQASNNIRIWAAQDYIANEQVIKDNVQYIAPNGATASDIPVESDKWVQIGGKDKDVNDALKSFVENPIIDYVDSMPTNDEHPDNYWLNLNDLSGNPTFNCGDILISEIDLKFDKIKIETNFGGNLYWFGSFKNGVHTPLIQGAKTEPFFEFDIDRNVEGYRYSRRKEGYSMSFGQSQLEDGVKKYIDSKVGDSESVAIILDSFLKPSEYEWEEIPMPLAGENDNAVITVDGQQFSAVGYANGGIPYSSLVGYTKVKIEGNFAFGAGTLILGFYNPSNDSILPAIQAPQGATSIEVDVLNGYGFILYTRQKEGVGATKIFKGKLVDGLPIEIDSVKKYIDNHVSQNSSLSAEKKAQIERPTKLLKLNFATTSNLPDSKGVVINGDLTISNGEGLTLKKFGTLEVQGSSSSVYPKKNWTFGLFNNEERDDKFKLRVGNWVPHDEFVFKSNWIDATHGRNLLSNQIWEDIVMARNGFPKRENETAYISGNSTVLGRFDSGALGHVDGVPAELYVNDVFYGLGNFNIGKKRENYDINQNNQNHIQLAAESHANLYSYNAIEWEIRSPKMPDANFLGKINAWFSANALTGQAFKDSFPLNHDLKNAIDFFLLAEFIEARDMFDKNFILTSWDGVKFYFMPYDMDTTYGLEWDGQSFITTPVSMRALPFWQKFHTAYTAEIKARYLDLKNKGVFTFDNFYKHADLHNKTIGVEKFKQDFDKWVNIPSNSVIYTSYPQLYEWVKNRLIWLDSQYL